MVCKTLVTGNWSYIDVHSVVLEGARRRSVAMKSMSILTAC